MQRRRFLLAGAPESGKSTLCACLLEHGQPVRKTQAPQYHGLEAVDLPGEYVALPRFRQAFLACAEEVDTIVVVVSAIGRDVLFPGDLLMVAPNTRLAGVISKIDAPGADTVAARRELAVLGIGEPVFEVSAYWPHTLEPLRHWIKTGILQQQPAEPCFGREGKT